MDVGIHVLSFGLLMLVSTGTHEFQYFENKSTTVVMVDVRHMVGFNITNISIAEHFYPG